MLPDINLLPKYERENSLSYILFIIGFILCLLLFILLTFFYFNMKGSLGDAEQSLNGLNQEKILLEEQIASLHTNDNTESMKGALAYVEKHIVPTSYFIDELMELLPDNGYLSNFNYNYQIVDIETQFDSMADAATYVVELNKSDYVKDIKINQMNAFELGAQVVEEENEDNYFNTIPRYHVSYSIDVNQGNLREAGDDDE